MCRGPCPCVVGWSPVLSLLPATPTCVCPWAGTRGRRGRGKQAAEWEQLPLRLSPLWLAVRRALGLVPGGGPGWPLPSDLLKQLEPNIHTWKGKEWAGDCGSRPLCLTAQREGQESPEVLRVGLGWEAPRGVGALGPGASTGSRASCPWALTGTFITHSCAVLGPTDCGKPIWLQEVSSRGHSPPDPTLSFTS